MVAFVSSLPTFSRRLPEQAFVFSPGNLRYDTGCNGISAVSLAWNWSVDNVGTMAFEVYVDNILASEVLYDVHYPGVDTWTTVRYMQPGTTHTFTVKARDEA